MRKWFPSSVGAVSLMLALSGLLPSTGCSDITAGQLADEPGPPRLVRIMAQDEIPGLSGFLTDLMDVHDKANPAPACDVVHVCPAQINGVPSTLVSGSASMACIIPMGMTASCTLCGTCTDPLTAEPVAVGTPPGQPGTNAGIQFRLVFSKILNPAIETVTIDQNTNVYTYALQAGTIELDDQSGKAVDSLLYYDDSGSPDVSSDPLGNFGTPFGPALVIKPKLSLAPNSKYTIVLHPNVIADRSGQHPYTNTAPSMALPDPFSFDFMTQDLALAVNASQPVDTNGNVTIAPNDIIQVTASANLLPALDDTVIKGALVPMTPAKGQPKAYDVEAWFDRGANAMMCSPNPRLLDLMPVSALGMPTDLVGCKPGAMGADLSACTYTLTIKGIEDATKSATHDFTATVIVTNCDPTNAMTKCAAMPLGDTDPASDPLASGAVVFPESCMSPPTDGGSDGGSPGMPDLSAPDLESSKADMSQKSDLSRPLDGGTKG